MTDSIDREARQAAEEVESVRKVMRHRGLSGIVMYNALKEAFAAGRAEAGVWEDGEDQWTKRVREAHPLHSGAHHEFALAMAMVSKRRSKGELVALVTWLLVRLKEASDGD